MGKATSVIEINGSRYDVASGSVIGKTRKRVIDGIVKQQVARKPKPVASPAINKVKKSAEVVKTRPARSVKSNAKAVHQRTEHSRTLVRGVVVKPSLKLREATKNFARASFSAVPKVDPELVSRARQISKDPRVNRFGKPRPRTTTETKVRPTAAARSASPSLTMNSSHQRLERLLDRALLQADAHKQSMKQHSHFRVKSLFALPKWLGILILAVALLLAALVVVWREVPAVAVKVAAIRSHVEASVPSYTPAGFSFKKAVAEPNAVTLQYQDKANNDSTYSVTQQRSNMDSGSLAASLTSQGQAVQSSQINGVPVVITDNKALCTNNGMQTTIENNAGLSSDQLLNIAKSVCSN